MIDLFELYEDFCGEYNTHQRSHIGPSTFVKWVNMISRDLFEQKFSEWPRSQKISDDVARPFLKSRILAVSELSATADIILYPADYGHYSSCRFFKRDGNVIDPEPYLNKDKDYFEIADNVKESISEEPVALIDNNRWSSLMKHRIKKPTKDSPAIVQYANGFKIAPKDIGYVVLDYLKIPSLATMVYTLGPNDKLLYDKSKSKPLEWSPLVKGEFMAELGKKFGKFTGQPFIYQTSQAEKNEK